MAEGVSASLPRSANDTVGEGWIGASVEAIMCVCSEDVVGHVGLVDEHLVDARHDPALNVSAASPWSGRSVNVMLEVESKATDLDESSVNRESRPPFRPPHLGLPLCEDRFAVFVAEPVMRLGAANADDLVSRDAAALCSVSRAGRYS